MTLRTISVRVGADEEFRAMAHPSKRSWEAEINNDFNSVNQLFRSNFNLEFVPILPHAHVTSTGTTQHQIFNTFAGLHLGGNVQVAYIGQTTNCGIGGLGEIGGNTILVTQRGVVTRRRILIHELNHIMGCSCVNMAGRTYHPNNCYMGSGWLVLFPTWCSHCINDINRHRNRVFPNDPSVWAEFSTATTPPVIADPV